MAEYVRVVTDRVMNKAFFIFVMFDYFSKLNPFFDRIQEVPENLISGIQPNSIIEDPFHTYKSTMQKAGSIGHEILTSHFTVIK